MEYFVVTRFGESDLECEIEGMDEEDEEDEDLSDQIEAYYED